MQNRTGRSFKEEVLRYMAKLSNPKYLTVLEAKIPTQCSLASSSQAKISAKDMHHSKKQEDLQKIGGPL